MPGTIQGDSDSQRPDLYQLANKNSVNHRDSGCRHPFFDLFFILYKNMVDAMQITGLLLPIIALIIALPSQAEVYRWTDENGKTHFSDKPHADATQLDIKPQKPSGIGSSQQQIERQKAMLDDFQEKRERQQQQATQIRKKQAATDRYCKGLRNRLKNYREADYLFNRDASGEKQHLSDQQKQREEQQLRAEIAERC